MSRGRLIPDIKHVSTQLFSYHKPSVTEVYSVCDEQWYYSFSSERRRALAFVTRIASCWARSTISRRFLLETSWAISAEYVRFCIRRTSSSCNATPSAHAHTAICTAQHHTTTGFPLNSRMKFPQTKFSGSGGKYTISDVTTMVLRNFSWLHRHMIYRRVQALSI